MAKARMFPRNAALFAILVYPFLPRFSAAQANAAAKQADTDVFQAFGVGRWEPPATSLPTGTNIFTWRDLHKRRLAWAQKNWLEEYRECGQHSEKWDGKARAFLLEVCEFDNSYCDRTRLGKLQTMSEELTTLGCTDPFVIYQQGRIRDFLKSDKEVEPYLRKGLAGFEASTYPAFHRYLAARRLQHFCETKTINKPEEAKEWEARKKKYLGMSVGDKRFKNGNQRYFVDEMEADWGSNVPGNADEVFREIEKLPDADPWIRLILEGRYHISRAWDARGGGWASSVSPDGWDVFGKELEKARAALEEAHRLHPEFPHAAASMITVTMGSGGRPSAMEWLFRAARAQFDYEPPYSKMLLALRPRWGGSHEQMLAFGQMCLDTKRFDTDVPRVYLMAAADVGDDISDWQKVFRRPDIAKHLEEYYEGTLGATADPKQRNIVLTHYLITAWAAKRHDNARRSLDQVGTNLYEQVFERYELDPASVVGEILLRTGPLKEELAKAEGLVLKKQFATALSRYEFIYTQAKGDSRIRKFLETSMRLLKLREKFNKGEWVDLRPDSAFSGWFKLGGEWTVNQAGTIVGTTKDHDQWHLMLVSDFAPEDNFEMRVTVNARCNGGVILGCPTMRRGVSAIFGVDRVTKKARLDFGWSCYGRTETPCENVDETFRLHLQVWNSAVNAYVNEKAVFENQRVGGVCDFKTGTVGLGGWYRDEEHKFVATFSNLQLRQLKTEPAPGDIGRSEDQGKAAK